ncbi:MAG: hypothetical protein CL674_16385 [Bdellovibrionaceae bacterium]|nr:hypothetical protein [Pseudobdellovibrionaceae bacterium]
MSSQKDFLGTVLTVLGAFLAAFLCIYSGKIGLYLFDSSIVYSYSYQLYKGYSLFDEIYTPLMPISGWLGVLSFKVFGFSYLSTVYTNSLLVLGGYIYIYILCSRYLEVGRVQSNLVAFVLPSLSLSLMGSLYYNYLESFFLSLVYLSLYTLLTVDESKGLKKILFSTLSFTVLLLLNKTHTGLMALVLCAFVIFVMTYEVKSLTKKRQYWTMAFSSLLFLAVIYSLAIQFQYSALFKVLSSLPKPGILFHRLFSFSSGGARYIDSLPSIDFIFLILFACVILKSKIYNSFKERARDQSYIARLLFFLLFVGGVALLRLVSEGANVSYLIYAFVLIFSLCHFFRSKNSQDLFYGVAVVLLVFSLIYISNGSRKAWDEELGFPYSGVNFDRKLEAGFFKGLKVSRKQMDLILKPLGIMISEKADKSFFFGPGLEMLYLPWSLLPPKEWPLWTHLGLNIKKSELESKARKLLGTQDYLVFSKIRAHQNDVILNQLQDKYVLSEKWSNSILSIYEKR